MNVPCGHHSSQRHGKQYPGGGRGDLTHLSHHRTVVSDSEFVCHMTACLYMMCFMSVPVVCLSLLYAGREKRGQSWICEFMSSVPCCVSERTCCSLDSVWEYPMCRCLSLISRISSSLRPSPHFRPSLHASASVMNKNSSTLVSEASVLGCNTLGFFHPLSKPVFHLRDPHPLTAQ